MDDKEGMSNWIILLEQDLFYQKNNCITHSDCREDRPRE